MTLDSPVVISHNFATCKLVSLGDKTSESNEQITAGSVFYGGMDLHAHTTASDGTLTPSELVELGSELGLTAIAVTDHDTLTGLTEAQEASTQFPIQVLSGVELSVEDPNGFRFHMLGYLFDINNDLLNTTLITIRNNRNHRNALMAQRMAELGMPVTMDDVLAEAGDAGEVIARPHFAKALLKKGIVNSIQEAFDRYLATGKPLYHPKEVLTPQKAISLLHQAGGIAVMAHPGLTPVSDSDLAAHITELVNDYGLDGLEAYYSQHTSSQTQRFLKLAEELKVVVTGGSDFHGSIKPNIPYGIVYNGQPAPDNLLEPIRLRAGLYIEAGMAAKKM